MTAEEPPSWSLWDALAAGAIGAVVAGAALSRPLAGWPNALPGGVRSWGHGWAVQVLRWGQEPVIEGPASLHWSPVTALAARLAGEVPAALTASAAIWLILGGAMLYGVTRNDAGRLAALGVAALGAGGAGGALRAGRLEWLALAPLALALHPRAWVAGLGAAVASAFAPELGLGAWGVAVLSRPTWRRGAVVSLLALPPAILRLSMAEPGWAGVATTAPMPVLPLLLVAAGLALWRGWEAWLGPLVVGVLAAGPDLLLGTVALPLPGALLAPVLGRGFPFEALCIPALVAAAHALRVMPRLTAAGGLAALTGLVLVSTATPGVVGEGIRQLSYSEGQVLHLPLQTEAEPEGLALFALYQQGWHGRPLPTGAAPLHESALFNEPLVVLSVNAALGQERYTIPERVPGDILGTLDVRWVVLHRDLCDTACLLLHDRILANALPAPQRDLAAGVDLYPVPPLEMPPPPRVELQDRDREGWVLQRDFLARWGAAQ